MQGNSCAARKRASTARAVRALVPMTTSSSDCTKKLISADEFWMPRIFSEPRGSMNASDPHR